MSEFSKQSCWQKTQKGCVQTLFKPAFPKACPRGGVLQIPAIGLYAQLVWETPSIIASFGDAGLPW